MTLGGMAAAVGSSHDMFDHDNGVVDGRGRIHSRLPLGAGDLASAKMNKPLPTETDSHAHSPLAWDHWQDNQRIGLFSFPMQVK